MGRPRDPSLLYAVVFLGLAAGAAVWLQPRLPGDEAQAWGLAWLLGINLVTLLAYGFDKAIAGRSVARVPERILLLLALVGGSPLAVVAMRVFRHKTIKPSFRTAFRIVLGVQVIVLAGMVVWRSGLLG